MKIQVGNFNQQISFRFQDIISKLLEGFDRIGKMFQNMPHTDQLKAIFQPYQFIQGRING
jgi:hypothetical protein